MAIASRRLILQGALLGVACACAGAGVAIAAETAAPGGKYVCPPCGCAADGKEFDKPDACPECGMPLVPKPAPTPAPPSGSRTGGDGGFLATGDRAPRRNRSPAVLG